MFGSTMEMTDIRVMKTCIALRWIFMDTCVASVSFLLSVRILGYVSRLGYNHLDFRTCLFSLLACEPPYP